MLTEVCEVYGPSPSYIRDVHRINEEDVYLVYRKVRKSTRSEQTEATFVSDTLPLDLTGCPLLTDLECDTNLSIMITKSNNWTEAEVVHAPISLNDARRVINEFNRKRKNNSSAIYCVCDGSDKNRTVVLGSCVSNTHFARTLISIVGCFMQSDPILTMENMLSEHARAVGITNPKVDATITSMYVMYGSNLKNCHISNSMEYNSSIQLEASWNNNCQYSVPKYVKSMEMTLQVIVGHKESQLYIFWEQLTLLNNYIAVLTTSVGNLDKNPISNEPENYVNISKDLCNMLNINITRHPVLKNNAHEMELDMQDLREYNLMDELWNVLTHCYVVGDLKICLHILFEELAENCPLKVIIPDHNRSSIANIINKILAGKSTIPTLSSAQALQCLIELGIEKLKNDYIYILDRFDGWISEKLIRYWNKITEQIEGSATSRLSKQSYVTVPPMSLVSTPEIIAKLNLLIDMHTTVEFLLLARHSPPAMHDLFAYIVQSIEDQCINLSAPVKLQLALPLCQLHELKVDLQSTNSNFLQGMNNHTFWNLKLATLNNSCEVTTIFHHTRQPIFPPSIYDKYDIPSDTEEDLVYYVTKCVSYVDSL